MDRFLSPSETARRFGVTNKALRLYERHGLIAPVRSASGWRTYGPAQVTRLVQILALKRLGLPLARIAQLLAGRDDLGAVLALQEDVLAHDSQHGAQPRGFPLCAAGDRPWRPGATEIRGCRNSCAVRRVRACRPVSPAPN
jgi:DNA-binding transcriptional MerR regulator